MALSPRFLTRPQHECDGADWSMPCGLLVPDYCNRDRNVDGN
jgi:hypothetical protein